MSNLYKSCNVLKSVDAIRVINSDELIVSKGSRLADLLKDTGSSYYDKDLVMEDQDEFQGISDLISSEEELISYTESAQNIHLEAQAASKAQAQAILDEANEEAQRIREEAAKEGFQQGIKEAEKKLQDEYQQLEMTLRSEVDEQKKLLDAEYQRQLEKLEPELLDVMIQVFEKVFHIEFDDKRAIMLHLIGNTLQNIESTREFLIRVGESQRIFLENNKTELVQKVGADVILDIVSDPQMEDDQCVIETENGIFECSLEVQLKNLIKALKSLSL